MTTILLVATWKAWTVPILIVVGIAGWLLRGLIDMADNFETGYGPDSRKASIQAWSILAVFVIAAIFLGLFGCTDSRTQVADFRDAHFDHHHGEPADVFHFDHRKWIKTNGGDYIAVGRWTEEVKLLAKQRDDKIAGDEKYFAGYIKKGYTPEQAIWHWEHDPWPNMGGGE